MVPEIKHSLMEHQVYPAVSEGEVVEKFNEIVGSEPVICSSTDSLVLTDEEAQLLIEAIRSLRKNNSVTITPETAIFSQLQACDYLNVQLHVMDKIIEDEEIPHTAVKLPLGNIVRYFVFKDLQEYKIRRKEEQRKALQAMRELDEEYGLL